MFNILKKIKKLKKKNGSKGITLVIAITVMTLLLSVSFSISNIVLRQIRITNTNNASKPAFFVADSAAECAFYYDTLVIDNQNGKNINKDFATSVFGSEDINTANNNILCGGNRPLDVNKSQTNIGEQTVTLTTFDVNYGDVCAKVEVTRTELDTKISSRGYNTGLNENKTGCDLSNIDKRRLVERGLTITY